MNQIAVVRTMADLQFALREYAEQLGMSREMIDERAGLQNGYAAKLLTNPSLKGLGAVTLPLVLEALGLVLVLTPVDAELERITASLTKRREDRVTARLLSITAWYRKIGRKGAAGYVRNVHPVERKRIAARAATARWRKWRKA
jgi:hypothetical protein